MRGALAIIGAGRVGRALGKRLHDLGWKIGAVVTQSEASARRAVRSIGGGYARATLSRDVLSSRLILISTPDDRITTIRLLTMTGMTRNEAVRALLQLTRQVLDNFERLGPRAAWTGPLARDDYGVVAAHTNALGPLPAEFATAYAALNDLAKLVLSSDSPVLITHRETSRNRSSRLKAQSAGGKA
jgi:predicted short-subunit dehydrogenase-like oxidoreductase (DUF2520 family)